jgi:hypothetical protein
MMQEHRLPSQQRMRGGKQMTSQQDGVSNQTFISEINQLLGYFVNNILKF